MADPLLYLLAVAMLLATPGPTNTLMATSGATAGIRGSLVLLLAELAGYLIAVEAIRLLLGPVIVAYAPVGVILKVAVSIYLVTVAVRLWRRPAGATAGGRTVSFANVFTTTLLNPKGLIFALTIIPQQAPGLLGYFAAFAAEVLVFGFAWIAAGAGLGLVAGTRSGALPKLASGALVLFAGYIAVSAF
jgi:threonine/homoserine/homoserine lactone efflux protein